MNWRTVLLLVAFGALACLAIRSASSGPEGTLASGTAWAAPDSVEEAKTKSLEALEAITRALQDLAKKAQTEAGQAAEHARAELRTSLEKACDSALRACQKVCSDDAKCLNACREGRRQCQS